MFLLGVGSILIHDSVCSNAFNDKIVLAVAFWSYSLTIICLTHIQVRIYDLRYSKYEWRDIIIVMVLPFHLRKTKPSIERTIIEQLIFFFT